MCLTSGGGGTSTCIFGLVFVEPRPHAPDTYREDGHPLQGLLRRRLKVIWIIYGLLRQIVNKCLDECDLCLFSHVRCVVCRAGGGRLLQARFRGGCTYVYGRLT